MIDLAVIERRTGEQIKVGLTSYKGSEYLDIRTHFSDDNGIMRPTKKGVTVPLWALEGMRDALDRAIKKTSGPTIATVESLAAHRARRDAEQDNEVIDSPVA